MRLFGHVDDPCVMFINGSGIKVKVQGNVLNITVDFNLFFLLDLCLTYTSVRDVFTKQL